MKRIGLLLPLVAVWLCSAGSSLAAPVPQVVVAVACSLPWETVDAVLKRVDELRVDYTYPQLVNWYHVGLLTVELIDGVYHVTLYDEDGITEIIMLDEL